MNDDFIMPEETPRSDRDAQMTDAVLAFDGWRCAFIVTLLVVGIGVVFAALYLVNN